MHQVDVSQIVKKESKKEQPTMSAGKINQKEYLKKYLSGDVSGHQKKKKKRKDHSTSKATVTIVDDDIDLSQLANATEEDLENYNLGEDLPQIAGIVDERSADVIAQEDYAKSTKWKKLDAREGAEQMKQSMKKYSCDASPPRRPNRNQQNSPDASPPRRNRSRDASPPRRRKSPDASPPRRRKSPDASPPRRPKREPRSPDSSPPRRHQSNRRASPPRRSRSRDASPPRRRKSPDASPPRKRRNRSSSNDAATPPKRQQFNRSRDASPPRRPKREPRSPDSASPQRVKQNQNKSSPRRTNTKMMETLEGKKAGLQNATALREENEQIRRREDEMFRKLAEKQKHDEGNTVRDRKTGRRAKFHKETEKDREQQKRDAERKEVYDRWGAGLKQIEDFKERIAAETHEMSKPLARHANDDDLENYLRNQCRDGDPMAKYMQKKSTQQQSGPRKPVYQGTFPENRFNIRPGYRWDGVDRSNGYEKKWFDQLNSKKAVEEEAYKYSVEDM